MSESIFNGMDQAFGSEFNAGSSELTEQYKQPTEADCNVQIAKRKSEIDAFITEKLKSDQGFDEVDLATIRKGIYQLLGGNTSMLERLEKDYFVTPSNRIAEVYSQLSSAQTGLLKTLIDLQKELLNKEKVKNSTNINTGGGDVTIVNQSFTAKDLQKLFSDNKKSRLLEEIQVDPGTN